MSIPIYYATKNRKKAFLWSLLSGLSEPIGAVIGYFVLSPFITPFVLNLALAFVAGIMVFISFDEMLPYVYKHKESNEHLSLLGMFLGMFVIAISLLII